jgi:hypothetical protein
MLRHIVSVGLAMTACAALIPTKVNAASITFLPVGTLEKNPGDSIAFILILDPSSLANPGQARSVTLLDIFFPTFDTDELSFNPRDSYQVVDDTIISSTTTIARFVFDVRKPVKDGKGDVSTTVKYQDRLTTIYDPTKPEYDVVPVPEPLTMFGAAAALGYGAILKRKYSKNTES